MYIIWNQWYKNVLFTVKTDELSSFERQKALAVKSCSIRHPSGGTRISAETALTDFISPRDQTLRQSAWAGHYIENAAGWKAFGRTLGICAFGTWGGCGQTVVLADSAGRTEVVPTQKSEAIKSAFQNPFSPFFCTKEKRFKKIENGIHLRVVNKITAVNLTAPRIIQFTCTPCLAPAMSYTTFYKTDP